MNSEILECARFEDIPDFSLILQYLFVALFNSLWLRRFVTGTISGLANMKGERQHLGSSSSAASPSTAAMSVIPGLANMRRVRRSIGASLVKKYIDKEQKKKRKRPVVVVSNGASQTSPGMWE